MFLRAVRLLSLSLVLPALLVGCDNNAVGPASDLHGSWAQTLTVATRTLDDQTETEEYPLEDCDDDDRWVFNPDGTGAIENPDPCPGDTASVWSITWTLDRDARQLTFEGDQRNSQPSTFTVEQLTGSELRLSYTYQQGPPESQVVTEVELQFEKRD